MKYKFFIMFMLCICSLTAFAQKKTYYVRDFDDQSPIDAASVISNKGKNIIYTDQLGKFQLQNFPSSETLKLYKKGYDTLSIPMEESRKNLVFTLYLRKELRAKSLSELSLFARKDFLSEHLKVDINQFPLQSSQDLLKKIPGLFIAQHAGGGKAEQIFLRGFDADHGTDIALFSDGIPVNVVSHAHGQGYADLHFLIPETIETIDFGKGAYYIDRGNLDTSGYAEFNTFKKIDKSTIKLEAGRFNTGRVMGMLKILDNPTKSSNAYIATEYNYTDGPFESKQHFNRFNIFGKFNRWFNDKDYLNFQISHFISSWDASGQIPERAVDGGIITRWGSLDPTEGGRTSRTNVSLYHLHKFDEGDRLSTQLWFSKYDFNLFSNFTFYLNDQVNGDEIQQLDNRTMYGATLKFHKTFKVKGHKIDWDNGIGFRMDNIADLQLNHVVKRNLLQRINRVEGLETNTYAYTGISWETGRWIFQPGLRADFFNFHMKDRLEQPTMANLSGKNAVLISPKFNISYIMDSKVMWFLKTGFGFHSNDLRVIAQKKVSETLPRSFGTDAGLRWQPIKSLTITPTMWYLHLNQEFVFVGDENVVEISGETQRFGADLGVRYQPSNRLYFNFDFNLARARFINNPKGEDYVPLAPRFTSTGSVNWRFFKDFSLGWQYRYLGTRPATEDATIYTQAYFINDVLLTYHQKRWSINAQVTNVLNQKWNEAQFATQTRLMNETEPKTDIAYTPGTPIGFRLGFAFNF